DVTPDGSTQDAVVWSFATETRDVTPPTVAAINPANGATDVRETTGVTITFSEAMNATTVEDGFSLWDAVRTWTGADGSFVWGPGGDVVAYTPAGTLSFDSVYHVALAATAADVSGNRLGTAFGSTFRTRPQPDTTPPRIVAT